MNRRVNCTVLLTSFVLLPLLAQTGTSDNVQSPNARLYFFTSPACAPCRQVEPAIAELANEGFPVTVINVAAQPDWAQHFKVSRTPTTILVANQEVIGRQTGLISSNTLRSWFAACSASATPAVIPETPQLTNPVVASSTQSDAAIGEPTDPTTHQGTTQPKNAAELRALKATVRLQVADPEGTSFATGTIIHSHQGECLVLTCGHVFRDSQGKGKISADYDFTSGQPKTATGRLLSYDANDRDIALITIATGNFKAEPVFVAQPSYSIQNSDQAFSIGCDHGEAPTIRRTKIKNLAKYNGVEKYDIYGRPVDGRSGGGLFTPGGQLVGVCNAAAVDFDEGIYVALNTIYWQFEKANLTSLFHGHSAIATNYETTDDLSGNAMRSATNIGPIATSEPPVIPSARELRETTPAWTNTNEVTGNQPLPANRNMSVPHEAIIILRSKNRSKSDQTITIANPTPELLNLIYRASQQAWRPTPDRMAEIRKTMPLPANPPANSDLRSQSPR